MICLLLYDVPDDGVRTKIADICLDYGLKRIQYSAFLGDLNRNRQEEIILKMQRRVGKRTANIQLFPLGEKELRLHKEIISDEQ